MGGGVCKGHRYVLALHILKHAKGFKKLKDLLTLKFDILFRGISGLDQFSEDLKVMIL